MEDKVQGKKSSVEAQVALEMKEGTYISAAWVYAIPEYGTAFFLLLYRQEGEPYTLICHQGGSEEPYFPDGKRDVSFSDESEAALEEHASSLLDYLVEEFPAVKIVIQKFPIKSSNQIKMALALSQLPFLQVLALPANEGLPN